MNSNTTQAATASNRDDPSGQSRTLFREYAEALVIAVILALFIRTFLFQAFKIPSGSMLPTLKIGDHILVNKVIYSSPIPGLGICLVPCQEPDRGDIIVFKFPKDLNRDFIKRVVGTPGDSVSLDETTLTLNGQEVLEPYAQYQRSNRSSPFRRRGGTFEVPDNHYLVLGDNRDNSQDSRFWGFLHQDLIKGKAFLIYWSWDSMKPGFVDKIRFDRLFHSL